MKTPAKDGAAVRVPPPLLYVAAIVASFGLQFIWPLPIGLGRTARGALAVLISLLGLSLVVGALRLFRKTGQDPKPWLPTPEIITSGVYRFTRNPMYVSLAVLQSAIGIGFGNLWVVLLVPLVCFAVYLAAIRHEEAYLEHKFGASYLDYKRSVRRWL